jgi:hypothetical protein
MNKSDQINELATALAKAQCELGNPKKNSDNPFFKSKYADLSEVINVSKHVLAENGLSIIQLLSFAEGCISIETVMAHSSGQFISENLTVPVAKQDAQSLGAYATYFRRYSWAAICGIAQEDDDANSLPKEPPKVKSAPNLASIDQIELEEYTQAIKNAPGMKELITLWTTIPKQYHISLAKVKDEMKLKFNMPDDDVQDYLSNFNE